MIAHFASSRFWIGLAAVALTLGSLWAGDPRYPELDDPFGPRHGPPPPQQDSRPNRPVDNRPPRPNADMPPPPMDSSADFDTETEVSMEQLVALERFLDMPPEHLAAIRQTIERVEAMSEQEKEALRSKIREFRQLQKDKIERYREVHQIWSDYPQDQRRLVHRYMVTLPREEAAEVRQALAGMNAEETFAYFKILHERAQALEKAGELPDLPESIRRWKERKERGDRNDRREREPETQDSSSRKDD